MSSTPYSTELTPDPFLRRTVLLSGAVLTGVGLVVIGVSAFAVHFRLFAACLWLWLGVRQVLQIAKGHERCRRIRIDCNGNIEILRRSGDWVAASLASGSVVLPRLVWLRFRDPQGRFYAELLRGRRRQNRAWRRFQVIWKHLGAKG